jgi:hypothetical protein
LKKVLKRIGAVIIQPGAVEIGPPDFSFAYADVAAWQQRTAIDDGAMLSVTRRRAVTANPAAA